MIYNNVIETIGNTPLIRINKLTKDVAATVVAKVETGNPGNSIKDRMALKMIEDAEKSGALKPGGVIVEGTSGNTGMGLAIAGVVKGYKCYFVTNDKQSKEKVDILKAVGAEVIVCPTNVEPDDPRSYYSVAKRLSEEIPNAFYANQYHNQSNPQAHYETTGPEIWEQTEGKITHLVVGVGTGGTISGVGKYLKEQNPNVKIIGIDTYGSALKKYHETGVFDDKEVYPYITEGIGEDIIPSCVNFNVIDHFEKVSDKDGLIYQRRLAREEGLFMGNSAGSAIAGVIQLKEQFKKDDLVVVIFHDHGSRYVGKAFSDDWMRERGFLDEDKITAKTIIERKDNKEFFYLNEKATLKQAIQLMKEHDISQLPIMDSNKIVGIITDKQILNQLMENPFHIDKSVAEIMNKNFPLVDENAELNQISGLITRENKAVLVKTLAGTFQIITEFDMIQAIS